MSWTNSSLSKSQELSRRQSCFAPWLHLRICLICGHVACCDDSSNRHATAHVHATSHPSIRSLEPGEDWNWCYVDDVAFLVDGIRGTTRIPPSPLLQ